MAKRLSNKRPKIARDSGRAKGLVKNTIGVLCIPIVITITRNFYFELTSVKALSEPARFFLLGFGAYVFMYIVLFKLEYFYVLGHEFVHTIFIWIFGGKIISVKVRKQSGSVTSTKKNIFIDLAPYLVPIYTLLVLGLYFAWSSFFEQVPPAKHFIFFVGFSFSFHLVMTIDKVKIEQPDFLDFGYLNSLVLIYLVNITMLALFFGFLFPDFVFKQYITFFFEDTKELYITLVHQLFRL